MKKPTAPKVKPGRAIQWDDADLDRLAEIHIDEDTPLMLAFARRYGSPRFVALLTARRDTTEETAADA